MQWNKKNKNEKRKRKNDDCFFHNNNLLKFIILRGWSGGAMVLGKLQVPGRPTIWIIVGQGPTALAVGAGGGCLDIFTLIYPFFPLSPSLLEAVRYRLKYCLKGPLNRKQPTNHHYSSEPNKLRNCSLSLIEENLPVLKSTHTVSYINIAKSNCIPRKLTSNSSSLHLRLGSETDHLPLQDVSGLFFSALLWQATCIYLNCIYILSRCFPLFI